jgi:hypothetical protein
LAKIDEQLAELSDNANEAKEALTNLTDQKNKLAEMSKTLSELTKGT